MLNKKSMVGIEGIPFIIRFKTKFKILAGYHQYVLKVFHL